MFRRISAVLVAVVALSPLIVARKREKDPVFGQIDSIVKSLSEISGLSEEHPVDYGSISKKQLARFLRKRIKKTLRPEEIEADELTLKMFGLVPQDFDLKKSTLDLLTEQAAAFYDYDEKKLFLLQSSPLSEEAATLAHELSHALADQHFNLEHFMDESPENDDENLARTAVVEGQASWLMLAYSLAKAGKPPVPNEEILKSVEDSGEASDNDYPILKASPLYIKQSLLFPYTDGIRFFDAVFRRMGKAAFDTVFTRPPLGSSQIFHPERYFAHEKLAIPELPKLNLGDAGEEITEGSVGEFDHRMLLWQYVGQQKAVALSPHLQGAQFRLTASGKKGSPVLEYVSRWDSAGSAAEYFEAYKKVLRGKWKRCETSTDSAAVFAGFADDGFFVTQLSGDTLVSVEGLAESVSWTGLNPALPARKASPAVNLS
ncbi:MAG: hypothetical protein M3Y24_09505 [Acidobacteriota bacterium]|nr:hypothetical protein [Acidobacteriota bacterium]